VVACPSCGQENPDGFRLCGMCGTPLVLATGEPRETRKVVSILFADVTGSTSLGERLDPESLRHLMGRYFNVTRGAIERHGGTVEKFIGDAVMAVFGIPVVHEDDALRAVRAAAEIRGALEALNHELEATYEVRIQSRIGVNTGEVVAGDASAGERYVTGDAVNVAARLEQSAEPGEILVGALTAGLVRDAVVAEAVDPLALRGKDAPVDAFRIVGVDPAAPGRVRRLDTQLVGREREIDLLLGAFHRAAREQVCHLFTLLGPPGVGKSRLVAELVTTMAGQARAARGRCLPYGEGITYYPMVEAVREAVGLAEQDDAETARAKLLEVLGDDPSASSVVDRLLEVLFLVDAAGSREELFWALRRLFEALARRQPLLLVLDDIHWGEATFLDFVEQLADSSRDAPILLLCMARPELLELRRSWAGGKLNATTVLLEPLDESAMDDLLVELLAGGDLEAEMRRRIGTAAEGNPLFVEELVGMLIDDGVLTRENGCWRATGDLASVPVPPSIRALLAARLDQLDGAERAAIEVASVEGQVFHHSAVAALVPEGERVGRSLTELVRRELIRPERPAFPGEEAFRFRHLLIRDAAYDAIPKESRAALHEGLADWLEGKLDQRPAALSEIAGYHLEQAYRYRREVSPGERQSDISARAARHLLSAGRRAYARGDMHAAANLLDRAAALLDREDYDRLELLPLLAAAVAESGRLPEARALLDEAVELARARGNHRIEWRAVAARTWWQQSMDSEVDFDELKAVAKRSIAELERLHDDFGLAYAWRSMSDVANATGDGAAWIDAVRRAFQYARTAGNRHEEWLSLHILGGAMFFGPTPADQAVAELEQIRGEIGDDVLLGTATARAIGAFTALQGRLDEGWALLEEARSGLTELGLVWGLTGIAFIGGRIAWFAGDLDRAERELRQGVDAFAAMGERARQSSLMIELAAVIRERGLLADAERLAEEAALLAPAEDVHPAVSQASVRGSIHACRGELAEGEHLLRRALSLIETTDFLDQHTLVLLDLAECLELAGRTADAVPLVERALALTRQKRNALLERRALDRLAQLGAVTRDTRT
jgi:class 3 adenylate cyclase/tetratricopeptide (TPR) repeat protein